jgi:hypothetical protein
MESALMNTRRRFKIREPGAARYSLEIRLEGQPMDFREKSVGRFQSLPPTNAA